MGLEQIAKAVTQMESVTQSNAANSEQTAAASEELSAQAEELGEMVTLLTRIVKGTKAAVAEVDDLAYLETSPKVETPVRIAERGPLDSTEVSGLLPSSNSEAIHTARKRRVDDQ